MYVHSIYRYPVKGLSPEPVSAIDLVPGEFFPGDRIYAVENGPSGFDPQAPSFRPKSRFLMLMKHPRLAELTSHFDHETHVLALVWRGAEAARGDLRTAEGRRSIECFLQDFCAGETRGPVRLLAAPEGFRFTDSIRSGFVSILNLASVRDLERRLGAALDPLRFRANVLVDGWEPWGEEALVGRRLAIGGAELRVLKTIDRCSATHVDPRNGAVDVDVMEALRAGFGRLSCGIYGKIVKGGRVETAGPVRVVA